MKIYYYKQQQNTFELFGKKSSPVKLRYIVITILTVFALVCWELKNTVFHSKQAKPHTTTLTLTPFLQTLPNVENPLLNTQFDEETRATSINIQNNIEHDFKTKEESPSPIHKESLNLKVKDDLQTITIKPRDTLGKIFDRLAINKKELTALINSDSSAKTLKRLSPGKKLLLLTNNHHVVKLSYEVDPLNTLIITRTTHNKFLVQTKVAALEPKQSFSKFVVYGSISTSAKKAGLNSKRTAQLATIFKSNVDFTKGNHTGDKVCVLFQDYFLNGKKVKEGEIVAAEYKTPTNTYQAVRFTDPKGNSGYYAPDGTSMQKQFLPAPLKFTRISSLFNPKRWHPVLHRFRHHQGVDYAAPYGTPIKSVANGTITLLRREGGYGNTIMIEHGSNYSTLYGHLSKYAAGLKVGSHVQQGQLIGYVGSSGLATGPHLHFEFRINGVHQNPLTVALPNGKSITHAYRHKFRNEVKKLLAKLDAHKNSTRS
jgi:murein DD-endopeptidase MepM/ murein hydrolase activator NlpD